MNKKIINKTRSESVKKTWLRAKRNGTAINRNDYVSEEEAELIKAIRGGYQGE